MYELYCRPHTLAHCVSVWFSPSSAQLVGCRGMQTACALRPGGSSRGAGSARWLMLMRGPLKRSSYRSSCRRKKGQEQRSEG